MNEYHKKVIDKNNATKEIINAIFSNVKIVDTTYADMLLKVQMRLQQWKKYLDELCDIVAPQNGLFSGEYMSDKLDSKLEQLEKLELDSSISQDKKLIDFDFTSFFLDNRNSTIDGIAAGWTSDWIQNLMSLFGIGDNVNEIAVRKSIESIIKESLTLKHEVSDFFTD